MAKFTVIASKREGKIQNPRAVKLFFDALKDGRWKLDATPLNQRSNQQNRYYFGLVIPLVQQGIKHLGTDITKEECHEFLKARFNSQELLNPETAEYIQIPRSTTAMSKEQFCEYISKIQQFSAEFLNVVIPDPSTQMALSYD